METSKAKIKAWQQRADDYRAAAATVTHSLSRQTYLTLAENYERLADKEQSAIFHARAHPKDVAKDAAKDAG